MNLAAIKQQAWRKLDEDPAAPVYFTADLMLAAINEGLNIYSSLTLSVEKVVSVPVSGTFTNLLATIPRLLVPLKVYRGSTRLRPSVIDEFAAIDPYWRLAAGTPDSYAMLGATLFVVNRKPSSPVSLTMTYAATAADLASDSDTPEIPLDDHIALVHYAIWKLSAIAGGGEFVSAREHLDRFLEIAKARAESNRARSRQIGLDRRPPELKAIG